MQSRVKETVSHTWTIENFANQGNALVRSPEIFSTCTNENKQIKFGVFSKIELSNEFVFLEFWYNYHPNVKEYFNYRVAILDERNEKLYSREYHWQYDSMCCYNIVNFILKQEISKFLINGHLTLLLEVDILEGPGNEKDTTKEVTLKTDLSAHYQSLLESGELSDVAFVVGGKEFKVHKAILAARSSVFKAMFSADLEEKKQNRVEITDVDSDVFEHLLGYIYSGRIPDLKEFGLELFVAADKYHLEHLKVTCEQSLRSSLSIETVSNVLLIADMHNADNLKSICINFITKNSAQVMATDGWKLVKSKLDLVLAILENMSATQS